MQELLFINIQGFLKTFFVKVNIFRHNFNIINNIIILLLVTPNNFSIQNFV